MKVEVEHIKYLMELGRCEFSHCKVDKESCTEDSFVIDAYFKVIKPLENLTINYKIELDE